MANDVSLDKRQFQCKGGAEHDPLCVFPNPDDPSQSSYQHPRVELALPESPSAPAPAQHQVPAEILIEIFSRASSLDTSCCIFDIRHHSWTISQVCRSWRSVSTSMCPAMWSKIDIDFNGDLDELRGKRDPISMLRTVLSRSGQHVLDIEFLMSYRAEEPFQWAMWEQVAAHAERWSKIYHTLGHQEPSHLACLRGRLVQLEECYIQRDYNHPGPSPDLIDAFEHTPKLKRMTLVGLGPTTLVPVSYANLETFKDQRRHWHASDAIHTYFISLLHHSPKLTEFHTSYHCVGAHAAWPRISKPAITYFSGCEETLFHSLSLPQLKHANLFRTLEDIAGCLGDFHDLLSHSQCHTLTHLSISDVHLNESLLPIFRLSPALASFSVRVRARDWHISDDDSVQSLFRHLLESPELVPRLESITFDLVLWYEWSRVFFFNQEMVDMIEARRASSLRKFQVTSTFSDYGVDTFCDWTDDDLRRLHKMKAGGFDVAIVAYPYHEPEERRIYV
ncbi:uncharacterized protein EV420DRAFT_1086331 [Desarmillaria tabescens]|uniref:F-box domain-containing protein n=1 Tax=Armillaria tabescens TaxID=1929756 RepID=A0AA39JHD6_ARMTA|nr:uncharacterized protein EV420DRAFT_1086331 [Desarmillaria tabescens]KAK0441806.1 hypothetical protein EV420DRAFT_1086331 [Desarmillaria tabescens]